MPIAAPIMASLRHIFRYIYFKLIDRQPFPDKAIHHEPERETAVSNQQNNESTNLNLSADSADTTH